MGEPRQDDYGRTKDRTQAGIPISSSAAGELFAGWPILVSCVLWLLLLGVSWMDEPSTTTSLYQLLGVTGLFFIPLTTIGPSRAKLIAAGRLWTSGRIENLRLWAVGIVLAFLLAADAVVGLALYAHGATTGEWAIWGVIVLMMLTHMGIHSRSSLRIRRAIEARTKWRDGRKAKHHN